MSKTIAILGDGAWGTAIAVMLSQQSSQRIRLWSAFAANAALLRTHRENVRLLPGIRIPPQVHLTESVDEAVAEADYWVIAIPCVYLRATLERFRALTPVQVPVLSLTKGIEIRSFQRPSEIVTECLGTTQVTVLSGPSHAEEVSRGLPTSVVIAGQDQNLVGELQRMFNSIRFRVYSSTDVIGVELAGALKNVIAIAAGVCDGLGFGDNAKSALLTRSLAEMTRFGIQLGAEAHTFSGMAGMGDLVTTCFSRHSRNRRLGEQLSQGQTLAAIQAGTPKVAEGVGTCRAVHMRAQALQIDLPITCAVHAVLFEGVAPRDAVNALMQRELRHEHDGY